MKKIYFLVLALGLFTNVNAQIINFPDVDLKTTLLAASINNFTAKSIHGYFVKIDTNSDGQIQQSEALSIAELDLQSSSISNISGIEYFTNLTHLYCQNNQMTSLNMSNMALTYLNCSRNQLTSLNVSNNTSLTYLDCNTNQLTSLNVSANTALIELNCSYNRLTNLNVSPNTTLQKLKCNGNLLTNLDVNVNTSLTELQCSANQLTNLNISSNRELVYFHCNDNRLTSLDLSANTILAVFWCKNNQLTSLDLSNNRTLTTLDCDNNQLAILDLRGKRSFTYLNCNNNQLTSLYIKNGRTPTSLNFSNNPSINYICADEMAFPLVQAKINTYGYSATCFVSSYCSFVPGGIFYTIQGNNKFDLNNNGCDVLDLALPNLKFNITNGTTTGSLIPNTSGNYSLPVIAGTHTVTPVLENPTHFLISPSTVNIAFPTQASPFTQNFCVTANGVHPDLEVALLPIIGARPGFDASYKVIYKNKGNTTQSGSVNLTFNDAVLDLVDANPSVTTQTVNNLSWDFTNLLPFETREIGFTLNVNSPMETPAVNNGDILNYIATITSAATDDLPNDNTFELNQTVVNSYDPNDKTCLEGATIPPSKVGDYVHYMIRFENNGTANAQNIVVKDMIDLAKFDINSLVPIKGSHSFVTNITAGNKVEFIFENIDLPFDDANNDGYVAFKIKTKSTLVLGNNFSNTASIYFDYNFPIVTNTATTTIAALSRQDFEFNNYFSLYPNPVSDVLNIASKETIAISSINIYNTLGQLVLVIPNAEEIKKVDVSSLSSGNYFIKINSDKGTSNTKFLKN